jgi:hypothetical protein
MKLTDEEVRLIEKSRRTHEQLLDHLTKNGVPSDIDTQHVLVKALGSLDKNVMTVARLRVDDEANRTAADVKDMIASIILEHKAKRHIAISHTTSPELSDSIVRENPIDGELEQGIVKTNYNAFMDSIVGSPA